MNMRTRFQCYGVALVVCALPALAADYTGWSGHRAIVLNTSASGANVATDVHDFPVLIRLGANEADILAAANGGNSIRFSKADDATPLPYEIESWSASAAAIWVKVDTIKGNNATQTIRMHWGNTGAASESNGAAVFDTAAGFSGVWHLGDSTGGISRDATVHATGAAWYNAPVLAPGLIGRAVNFNQDGSGDPATAKYLMAPYNPANDNFKANSTDGITLSAWVKRTANSGGVEQGILGRYNWGTNGRQAMIALNDGDQIRLFRSVNGTNSGGAETNFGEQFIVDGQWTHVVATVKNGAQVLYVNGAQDVAQNTPTIGSLDSIWATSSHLSFGRMAPDHGGNPVHQSFHGLIDEARYTRTARSAAWVKLEYENQKAANTLVNIGLPGVPGAPTDVAGVAGLVNSGSITVSWKAPADNGGVDITGYKAMAVEDTAKSCTAPGTLTCIITGLTPGSAYTFVVRASNPMGPGALSSPSAAVNAPVSLLGGGAVMLNVGAFTGAYTFRLADNLGDRPGVGDRLRMTIVDVSGKQVWSRALTPRDAGRTVSWNGLTTTGARAGAGVYFVRVFAVTPAGKMEAVKGGVTVGR